MTKVFISLVRLIINFVFISLMKLKAIQEEWVTFREPPTIHHQILTLWNFFFVLYMHKVLNLTLIKPKEAHSFIFIYIIYSLFLWSLNTWRACWIETTEHLSWISTDYHLSRYYSIFREKRLYFLQDMHHQDLWEGLSWCRNWLFLRISSSWVK